MQELEDYKLYQPGTLWIKEISQFFESDLSKFIDSNDEAVKLITIENDTIAVSFKEGVENYLFNIKFNPVTAEVMQKLKNYFFENPITALELTQNYQYSLLINKLKEQKINILPEKISDVEIFCSCHEKNCKHIPFVFNQISMEIDKNPAVLFSLRGIDKTELIEIAGFVSEEEEIKANSPFNHFIPVEEVEAKDYPEYTEKHFEFPNVDLEAMFSIIPENPSFADRGGYKTKLFEIYQTILEDIGCVVSNESPVPVRDSNFHLYFSEETLKVFITRSNHFLMYLKSKGSRAKYSTDIMSIPVEHSESGKVRFEEFDGISIPIDMFFEYFLNLTATDNIVTLSRTALFFRQTAQLALAIVKSGSFVSEIVKQNDSKYVLKYVPLVNTKELADNIEYHLSTIPREILFIEGTEKVFDNKNNSFILSEFITFIIDRLFFLKPSKVKPSPVSNIFVKNRYFNLELPKDFEVALSISEWIKPIYSTNNPIKPLVRLEPDRSGESFALKVDLLDKNNAMGGVVPFSELFNPEKTELFGKSLKIVKTDICKQLLYASNFLPELRTILDSKGENLVELDLKGVFEVVTKISVILNQLGIAVVIPKELQKFSKMKVSLKLRHKKNAKAKISNLFDGEKNSFIKLDEIMDFSYEIAIGDTKVSKEEFMELISTADGLIKYKEQYIILKPEEIQAIMSQLEKPADGLLTADKFLHSAISGVINDIEIETDETLQNALNDFVKVEDINYPDNLQGTLRPYQERGFKWLYSNLSRRVGSCLADDMGLGKTIQVISLILKLKEEKKLNKPAIVVCPTTLVGNWLKECEKFAPSLNVAIYHGTDRELNLEGLDVLVTTYTILRIDNDKFKDTEWGLAVIDEAQNIKNPDTTQTQMVKALKANSYIAMTGTPVENRLTELWSIFDFLNKDYLGNMSEFQNVYSVPIERFRDEEKINRLRKATSPFILRRLKTDKTVIDDLPDKIVIDEYCYLTKEQAAIYEKVLENSMKTIATSNGIDRRGQIFKLITSLKQICNHPMHFSKTGKLTREVSGKTDTALTLLESVLENNEKAIIFTQYKEMGDLLVELLKAELDQNALFFHGSLSREKRDMVIDDFQNNDATKLMVLSLKAGGTGLNLTAATNVIHYDLWWNPAVEDQATDRAFRIGQTKNVNVHRLITLGTFEEKIDSMIKSKKELADLTVHTGEKWLSELSDKEIRDLFSLSKY